MGAPAALALWLLLLWQLTVAPASPHLVPTQSLGVADLLSCGPDEYWTDGHCCRSCPPGYHVSEPCGSPHTQAKCEVCAPGTFSAYPNGLLACLPCSLCRHDQVPVQECSATSDRRCQCQEGHFSWDVGGEEPCRRCSRCPEGTTFLQTCNATVDTVCGAAGPGSRHHLWVIGGVGFCTLVVILVWFYLRPSGSADECVDMVKV